MVSRLALGVALAACDSAGPEAIATDPANGAGLIGSWELVDRSTDLYVTSRVDQSLLDMDDSPSGAITVRGDLSDNIQFVQMAGGENGRELLQVSSLDSEASSDASRWSTLSLSRSPVRASAHLSRHAAGQTTVYTADLDASRAPFAYRAGQVTLPRMTLTASDGSGREVSVEGSLRFATIAVRAGEEMRVHSQPYGVVDDGRIAWVFDEDGRFEYRRRVPDWGTTRTEAFPGTWRSDAAGKVAIDASPISLPSPLAFEVAPSALRLTERFAPDACAETCRTLEGNLFAEPGSIVTSRSETVFALEASRDG